MADDSKLRLDGDGRSVEQFVDRSRDPNVVGFLHRPASAAKDALVLTHGAGSNCRAQLLVDVAEAFSEAGMLVLRCDLPYRQSSPHGPPKPGSAERDREGLRNAALLLRELLTRDLAMRDLAHGRIFLGGHSYGGRQASMLAAASPELVDGLVLLSYPLHPPRKPQQLRTQHFPELRTPTLFVHGMRDPFGSEVELTEAVALIPARTELLSLAGSGHDLKIGKKGEPGLAERVRERFVGFFGES